MSDYFDRIEAQLARRVEAGASPASPSSRARPRSWLPGIAALARASGPLASAAAVLVVVAVVAVALLVGHRGPSGRSGAPPAARGVAVTLVASPVDSHSQVAPDVNQAVSILRRRLTAVLPGAAVSSAGGRITVRAAGAPASARSQILALAAPGRLEVYDWEANVVTPTGKTVASRLAAEDPVALEISQGAGTSAPGDSGAGGMSLREAKALVAKLPPGYVVVEASAAASGARFFVLRHMPSMTGSGVARARQGTDQATGAIDLELGLKATGTRVFRHLTATLAARGAQLSSSGQSLNQHLAVALDDRLISVPSVDFKQYPDGVDGTAGVSLAGNFTAESARALAALLRFGPLPVLLRAAG